MKKIVFGVNPKQSYYRCFGFPDVKPAVQLPFIVPLDLGGTITFAIDEKKNTAVGFGTDLLFTSDAFEKDPAPGKNITGNLQQFQVFVDLDLTFDPKTGQILSGGGGTWVRGMPDVGGDGRLQAGFSVQTSSALLEGNSTTFDLSNGLGCKGGLVLDVSYTDPISTNPRFSMHVEAVVSQEDIDGDGVFEVVCPPPIGVPIQIREGTMQVTILFGAIAGGGGIGILPNGHVIPIPPPDPVLMPIAEGVAEVVRGLAMRDLIGDSENPETRTQISRLGLEVAKHGLEGALKAVSEESNRRG